MGLVFLHSSGGLKACWSMYLPLSPDALLLVLVLAWCELGAWMNHLVLLGEGGRGIIFQQALSSIRVQCVGRGVFASLRGCLDCCEGRKQSLGFFFFSFWSSSLPYQLAASLEMVRWGWYLWVVRDQNDPQAGEYASCWVELPCSVTWLHNSTAVYRPWTELSWDTAVT